MITQELVEERLAGLRAGRAKAVNDIHAYDGAIQDCEWFLAQVAQSATITQSTPSDQA